ncbi:RHS repeat-associated core domain-containing protein [Methylomonas montana]|nr:RHS repeat-associated core domain-containing protein [Methylomonas montana]WKJ92598.1 RHS repeat-associated core domain-containing protein [Methylomonas montana]
MGDRHYAYDAAGNLIEEKRGKAGQIVTRYQYDSDNRLIRAETPQGSSEYRYDALGRRIAKHTAQGETRFQYDGPRLLAETDSQRSRTYLFEPGSFRPLALHEQDNVQASSATYHYHLDHLGTPRELTDSDGKIVWSARYRAYGNLALADVQEIDNPLRFQGQYFDAETGLHYNLNRYYDPNAGRFIHQDPIGLEGGTNVYRYAPNPVNWIDPLGLTCDEGTTPAKPKGRTGPKGVDPDHHNANVMVRDASGDVISHERIVSGNMTPTEKALGFPKNTLASHTEARAVTNTALKQGDTMTITGQRPPCPSCKGYMNRAAEETGATIRYQWRDNGQTQRWTAGGD